MQVEGLQKLPKCKPLAMAPLFHMLEPLPSSLSTVLFRQSFALGSSSPKYV